MDEIPTDNLFDSRSSFPDRAVSRRFDALVGIDDQKTRLVRSLAVLVNPDGIHKWAAKFHAKGISLLDFVERRPPLVILAGDVGTGKTELASTVGDPVARQENIAVTLFPLSLATRGSGRVGEMTSLISAAFDETVEAAERLKTSGSKARGAIILLVDEADAIVQSRENAQMHHEDRAGVNAFIRGVDRLAAKRLPAAVMLCTNRLGAIDPAVQRRAAEILIFQRPNEEQRFALLSAPLIEVGFSDAEVRKLVAITGAVKGRDYGFTYSDLTQRLLPRIVLDAYPDNAVTFSRAMKVVETVSPTAPFNEARNAS
jgi:AAA+ superfamily predicted ATPase